jgi:phosphoribosylaminoimidazole-succinocarboxamide synthase
VPEQVHGRAVVCERLAMYPVECVARGYLTGTGLLDYEATASTGHSVCGIPLPEGLEDGSRLPEPIFTPTTKAAVGQHDEFMTFADVAELVGHETADRLRELTLAVYDQGAALASERGIIVADTKLEFGWAPGTRELTLADEVLTPDSSRFWPADEWQPGRAQFAFDKQDLRDWATSTGWDKRPPGPEVPAEVVQITRERYLDAYERITGSPL